MRIGIDFDNTIAAYDKVFLNCARERGLLPAGFTGGKQAVRDAIRNTPDGERRWQRLQGDVYGAQMRQAELFPGVQAFLKRCSALRIPVYIISHKTEFAPFDAERVNLREAARDWMRAQGFFATGGLGLDPGRVSFHDTRAAKLQAISDSHCDVFIDDLEEVLADPGFPTGVRRILFTADNTNYHDRPFPAFSRWQDISNAVFGQT